MTLASRLLAACAPLSHAAAAWAHEGHGLDGGHWHATDAALFVALALAVGIALWFGGRKR